MTNCMEQAARLLVVEDDMHIAQVLVFMLEREGYIVHLMNDGNKARDFIETSEQAPALVLLDVMLPYVDGFQLVCIARSKPGWADVPIIMLTAKNTEHNIVRALDAGANDYVVKPFNPQELLARVRRLLKDTS